MREKTDWESIHSMSEGHELLKLYEFAQNCPKKTNLAIELGSYQGKTATLLAEVFDVVLAIDLYGHTIKGISQYDEIGNVSLNEIVENIKQRKLIGRVIPIVAPTSILPLFSGVNPDFIFVDAGHDYDNAFKDLLNSHHVVNKEGVVAVHDYKRPGFGHPPYDPNHPHHGPHDPWWGVAKAVDELIEQGYYEIIEHYCGIVALKPKEK